MGIGQHQIGADCKTRAMANQPVIPAAAIDQNDPDDTARSGRDIGRICGQALRRERKGEQDNCGKNSLHGDRLRHLRV